MVLSDRQIERYSRQIIVPRLGGAAQERVLAARMILAGDVDGVELPLAYLVGAGVGTIVLETTDADLAKGDALIARSRELNPEVVVSAAAGAESAALVLAIIASGGARDAAARLSSERPHAAFVAARLDTPAKIAILPAPPPPCLRCADGGAMLAPVAGCDSVAEFVAMVATAEAFKLLAGYASAPSPVIIDFDGYQSRSQAAKASPGCACSTRERVDAR
jgi:molybdopterin-synthase adenylyltransferase